MKALKPTDSPKLQSRTAVQRAPLWLMNATLPGRAIAPAKVALSPDSGLITPRQFGPITRILPRPASSRSCRSSAAPSAPTSLNPAEMTIAAGTPASTHSRMTPGAAGAGVTTTASSTRSGKAATLGYALTPRIEPRFGLTGKTIPPKGEPIRFQNTVRPTLPGFSVAPITATELGAKNGASVRVLANCRMELGGLLAVIGGLLDLRCT
jgi:hypothetical protein